MLQKKRLLKGGSDLAPDLTLLANSCDPESLREVSRRENDLKKAE